MVRTGYSTEQAVLQHDKAMLALLNRCREHAGLRFNSRKLKFKLDKVAYMGHVFSSEGLYLIQRRLALSVICQDRRM